MVFVLADDADLGAVLDFAAADAFRVLWAFAPDFRAPVRFDVAPTFDFTAAVRFEDAFTREATRPVELRVALAGAAVSSV